MISRVTVCCEGTGRAQGSRAAEHSEPSQGKPERQSQKRFSTTRFLCVSSGACPKNKEGHDVARALWPSVLVVHAESTDCAVRERHAFRVSLHRAGYARALGRVAAALAAAQV